MPAATTRSGASDHRGAVLPKSKPQPARLSRSRPNRVARDGPKGGNSPYTASLAKIALEPGLRIEDVFKRVRQIVSADTQGAQVPWESSSLVGDFYPAGPLAATAPLQKLPQTTEAERNWAEVNHTKPTRALDHE